MRFQSSRPAPFCQPYRSDPVLLILDETRVKIGEQTVIGSGSVVTRDIPAHVVAAGNPCRVIRRITEEDARYWRMQQYGYEHDPDISPGTAASENQI